MDGDVYRLLQHNNQSFSSSMRQFLPRDFSNGARCKKNGKFHLQQLSHNNYNLFMQKLPFNSSITVPLRPTQKNKSINKKKNDLRTSLMNQKLLIMYLTVFVAVVSHYTHEKLFLPAKDVQPFRSCVSSFLKVYYAAENTQSY